MKEAKEKENAVPQLYQQMRMMMKPDPPRVGSLMLSNLDDVPSSNSSSLPIETFV